MAPPVVAFALATVSVTLFVVAPINAVHVPVVAVSAEVKEPPASVDDALNLPKIVHS